MRVRHGRTDVQPLSRAPMRLLVALLALLTGLSMPQFARAEEAAGRGEQSELAGTVQTGIPAIAQAARAATAVALGNRPAATWSGVPVLDDADRPVPAIVPVPTVFRGDRARQ